MQKISITFSDLDADQAASMVEAYKRLTTKSRKDTDEITATPAEIIASEPAAPAPAAPQVPTVPTEKVSDVADDFDIEGVPWNADVHAGGKTKKADGTWRAQRGVDKAKVAAWRAQHVQSGPPAVPAADPAPAAPTIPAELASRPVSKPTDVDYASTVIPLWQKLVNERRLPLAEIQAILQENGHDANDFTAVPNNATVRNAVYALLIEHDKA